MFHVDPASLDASPAPAGTDAACAASGAPPADPRALIERRIAALSRLAEIGMAIAEAAGRAATDPAADEAARAAFHGDPCLAYTRVARAVRMTFALQSRLLEDLTALDKADRLEAIHQTTRRRLRLERLVAEALDAERPDALGYELKRLRAHASERLYDADEEADLLGRPFEEIVARICADLGLSAEWTAHVVAGAALNNPSSSDVAEGGDPRTQPALHRSPPSSSDSLLGRRVCAPEGAPPEDDAEEEDTFLEWPPPA